MASYVKYETPDEVVANILEALSVAKDTGKLRKGINEATKSVERRSAKLIVMAEDVQPEEIIIHMPSLCDEKGIPYAYVRSKKDLGGAVGIAVGTSTIAIEDAGSAAELLQGILKRLPKPSTSSPAPKEEKKEEKPAGKPKEKKEEPKAEEKKEKKEEKPEKEEAPKEGKKEEPKAEEKKEKKEEKSEEKPKEEKKEEPKAEEKKE
jgi:large subunit ribosomal protein L7Ae